METFKFYLYTVLSSVGVVLALMITSNHFKIWVLRSNCSPLPLSTSIIGFAISKWIGFDSYIWVLGILLEFTIAQGLIFPFLYAFVSRFGYLKEQILYQKEIRPEGRTHQLILHQFKNGVYNVHYSGNSSKLTLSQFELPIDLKDLKWRYLRINFEDPGNEIQIVSTEKIFEVSIFS